jgi:hypothetical protein
MSVQILFMQNILPVQRHVTSHAFYAGPLHEIQESTWAREKVVKKLLKRKLFI